jgi:phosphoglycerol transferase MdoB-like AlkP superfamily enzyme
VSNNSSASSGGIGVLGLLGVAFVVLKLCHVINWSWWWVTAPFWGGLALFLFVLLIMLLVALLVAYRRNPRPYPGGRSIRR